MAGILAGTLFAGNSAAETNLAVPAKAESAAEWALSLPENARMQALQGIMGGWAQTDPAAAAAWSKKLGDQDRWAVIPIVSAWAYRDAEATARWVALLPEGQPKMQSLEVLGSAWGASQRNAALGWAEKIQPEAERQAALGGVIQSWAREDGPIAIKYAQDQKDEKLREFLLGKAISGWSARDRKAVEKWVQELPEGDFKITMQKTMASTPVIRRRVVPIPPQGASRPPQPTILDFETPAELLKIYEQPVGRAREDALIQYLLDWCKRDKEKATRWIAAKLKGYVLGRTAGIVAREWSKQDLSAAAEWVRQIPTFFRDFVARMGAEWAAEQPKEVAEVVLKWPDDSRRQVVTRGVCEAWAKKDPAAALAWMEALPVGETRKGALKGVAIGWSQVDAAGSRAWAEKITDENEKKEAKHYIIHGLARSRPQEAIAYLKTFPNGESDLNLIYCLGKEWALVDVAAAADWAKSLPAGSVQESGCQAVVRQWVYEDAVRAADWAENIPDKQSRILAAKAVMELWVDQNPSEALAWARQIKDPERQLEILIPAVRTWARSDLPGALHWANHLPDGKQKTEILGQLTPTPRRAIKEEVVKVGQDAPLFTAKTVDGKELKLVDYKGKFVLLDFWATWCGPCLGETPNLKAVFEKYGRRDDFVLIGLSLDKDPAQPAAYAKENGCEWVEGFLGDWGKDEVTKMYGVRGIPSIWLIGPDGKVLASGLRGDGIMAAVATALDPKK